MNFWNKIIEFQNNKKNKNIFIFANRVAEDDPTGLNAYFCASLTVQYSQLTKSIYLLIIFRANCDKSGVIVGA